MCIRDSLVDLAAQHHLDDIHGFTIGVAQTVDKLALLADLSQHFIDLRAAAVYAVSYTHLFRLMTIRSFICVSHKYSISAKTTVKLSTELRR